MKKKRKSKKRIHGNDRAYMMLARDVRRRWLQYGENRKIPLDGSCYECGRKTAKLQIDHIEPLGARPRAPQDFCWYIAFMFERDCQALCKTCHKIKTDAERKRRKAT